MTADVRPPFSTVVEFVDDQVLVRLRGELDMCTAPDLEALLEAVIGRQGNVVVDAAELEFMDARGAAVFARAARATADAGGRFVMRAPSPSTRWVIDAAGLDAVLGTDVRDTEVDPRRAVRRVAAVPADRAVLRAALGLVVEVAETMVPGTDVATISLAPGGRLRDVISRREDVAGLDQTQYAVGQGPCLEAAEALQPMHVSSTTTEERWPAFIPHALERGVNSILSTPLPGAGGAFGALNLYAFRDRAFPGPSHDLAATLADAAARALDNAAIDQTIEEVAANLRYALETRHSIAVAQGVLAERGGVSPDAAYTRLRRMAERTGRPLRDVAAGIISPVVSNVGEEEAVDVSD